jgi:hypothetical protein
MGWRWEAEPFGTAPPNQNPPSLSTFVYNLLFPAQYFYAETDLYYKPTGIITKLQCGTDV